jgi:hypothetical protein
MYAKAIMDGLQGNIAGWKPRHVTKLEVAPQNPLVALGDHVQLRATATWNDNTTSDATSQVTWSVANPTIATVDQTGLLTGRQIGGPMAVSAAFSSAAGSISSSTSVTVSGPKPKQLTLTPAAPIVVVGKTLQFNLIMTLTDGTQAPVTASTAWVSSNPAIATVSSSGMLTSAAAGASTVTATAGGLSASTTVTVLPGPPTINSFSPLSGPVGTTVVISGANFTGATQVLFGTVPTVFTLQSSGAVRTTVPAAAGTDRITIKTPAGTATSKKSFRVARK